jgi:ankyrin repeat protein
VARYIHMTTRNQAAGVAAVLVVALGTVGLLAAEVPLIDAVASGDHATVLALLDEGVDVDARRGDGATALHWAVHLSDRETVDTLLRAGADVDAVNDLGVAPLLIAASNGDASVVKLLLGAGADPNGGPPDRERPLMRAAWVGSLDVVTALLDAGADPNGKESARGQTALMWAVSERHPVVVKVLLERGADAHATTVTHLTGRAAARDVTGYTPLLFAARVGDLLSVRMLLDAGANQDDAASDRLSALGLATIRGHIDVAMLLLEYGADPNAAEPGHTPLHWAAGWWETTLTTSDFRAGREGNDEWNALPGLTTGKVDLVRALLAHGADPGCPNWWAPRRSSWPRLAAMRS